MCCPCAVQDIALWGRLGPNAVSHMSSFTPQEFAQTLWAFATTGMAYKVRSAARWTGVAVLGCQSGAKVKQGPHGVMWYGALLDSCGNG